MLPKFHLKETLTAVIQTSIKGTLAPSHRTEQKYEK